MLFNAEESSFSKIFSAQKMNNSNTKQKKMNIDY